MTRGARAGGRKRGKRKRGRGEEEGGAPRTLAAATAGGGRGEGTVSEAQTQGASRHAAERASGLPGAGTRSPDAAEPLLPPAPARRGPEGVTQRSPQPPEPRPAYLASMHVRVPSRPLSAAHAAGRPPRAAPGKPRCVRGAASPAAGLGTQPPSHGHVRLLLPPAPGSRRGTLPRTRPRRRRPVPISPISPTLRSLPGITWHHGHVPPGHVRGERSPRRRRRVLCSRETRGVT